MFRITRMNLISKFFLQFTAAHWAIVLHIGKKINTHSNTNHPPNVNITSYNVVIQNFCQSSLKSKLESKQRANKLNKICSGNVNIPKSYQTPIISQELFFKFPSPDMSSGQLYYIASDNKCCPPSPAMKESSYEIA